MDVDSPSNGPVPDREESWFLDVTYRARVRQEAWDWPEAERLIRPLVNWLRPRAATALATPSETMNKRQRNTIQSLGSSLAELAMELRDQGNAECVTLFETASRLHQLIGDRADEAALAFNLGHVYKDIRTVRDLTMAEQWYRRTLELSEEGDGLMRGKCYNQLGHVATERFEDAKEAQQPTEELLRYLNAAAQFHVEALAMLPPDAVPDLAIAHNRLGGVFATGGDCERALPHLRNAIQLWEKGDDLYAAAGARLNAAVCLERAGRLADAREYAQAALRGFQTFGRPAARDTRETQEWIATIEHQLKAQGA